MRRSTTTTIILPKHTLPIQRPCTRTLKEGIRPFWGRWRASISILTKLPVFIQDLAKEAGLAKGCFNPFKSIIIRCLEVLFAFDEAIHIVENYEMPDQPAVEVKPRAGTGYGATEAPGGSVITVTPLMRKGLFLMPRSFRRRASTRRRLKKTFGILLSRTWTGRRKNCNGIANRRSAIMIRASRVQRIF